MTDATRRPEAKDPAASTDQAPPRPPNRPWRAEGLPRGRPEGGAKPPRDWFGLVARGLLVYAVVFGLLTLQDRLNGPATISYSEFVKQVQAGNVSEVFSRGESIQGTLREARPIPGREGAKETYQRFATERPAFARDDLLASLERSGASVRATPVIQERGTFTNLLISIAPIVLMILFYRWIFRRQQGALGGMFGAGAKKKPVDPETVRVTFEDVAGIDEVKARSPRSSTTCARRRSTATSARGRPRACCCRGPPAPARRCSPGPPPARPRCPSSPPAPRSSSR
jgi:cell division protease FtsH